MQICWFFFLIKRDFNVAALTVALICLRGKKINANVLFFFFSCEIISIIQSQPLGDEEAVTEGFVSSRQKCFLRSIRDKTENNFF